MSSFLPAPLNLPFDQNLSALRRRSTPAVEQPRLSPIRCSAAGQSSASRRSANFQPNLWSNDYIQSLAVSSPVEEKDRTERIKFLEEKIRDVIGEKKEVEEQLELIDHLQQLGVAYHFKDGIKDCLTRLHASIEDLSLKFNDNLHATALLFRLLRENGFSISEDMFKKFRDEKGEFRDGGENHTEGMLSLYEASYYGTEGEMVLQEAMEFTTEHLKNLLEEGSEIMKLRKKVADALELPLNWRMERVHTRRFIEACQRDASILNNNPLLLEFAKLDFNAVQSIYKKELSALSRWWTKLGVVEKLPFARDRLTENYLWTVGWAFEPEHWRFREALTKGNCFVTMIDDVYDVYGTLDELELFTRVVDRWDINAIDKLPDYMKILFLAIFNTTNEEAYKVMKEKGLDIIRYLRGAWADLCKAYLVEAKWYHQGCTPPLAEYLENAQVTITGPLVLINAYCLFNDLSEQDLARFSGHLATIKPPSILARLYNDLATSTAESKRGDVAKAIACCMHETGVSEAVARRRIKELIKVNWRRMNGDRGGASSLEEHSKRVAIGMARSTHFFYGHGDGFGQRDGDIKSQLMALLVNPIVVEK
ncbi:monoterpene synthase 8, chloroplastic-like [Curcuma longa]|uniref:monoterpene synthase 8, chloroplastic-like n=1 Tax=Curcuma longa TaxID=136217 RepID=UPI003D9E71A6